MKRCTRLLFVFLLLAMVGNVRAQTLPTIQAIHNVSDPSLDKIDLYVSVSIIVLTTLDNFAYRTSTDTIVGLAGIPIDLGLADSTSGSVQDTLKKFTVILENDKNYLGIGAGVLNPAQFAPNPDGRDTEVNLFVYENAKLSASSAGVVDVLFMHGVTDAPAIDVRVVGGATIANDIQYGDFGSYVSLPPGIHTLEITDASGTNVLGVFTADLSSAAGTVMTIYASGFADPSQNQDGAALGLFATNPLGGTVEFPRVTTGIDDEPGAVANAYRLAQNYPNPFNPSTTIEFALPVSEHVTLAVFDITGKRVATLLDEPVNAGLHRYNWSAKNLPSGAYFYRLQTQNFSQIRKLMLVK